MNQLHHISSASLGDLHFVRTKDVMLCIFDDPALIPLELARGDSGLEDLIKFFQASCFRLW